MVLRVQLLLTILCVSTSLLFAQENRTYDGTNNNISNPNWGAVNENLLRISGNGYGDQISSIGGADRANPRDLSNQLADQEAPINDQLELSTFVWVFGQFIDHDLGFTNGHPTESADIQIPVGDPVMDPMRTGTQVIRMKRNSYDPNTGTSTSNLRMHPNLITAYIDGSAVYGSTQEHADWLRTFEGGKLKTSRGNLLPYNTIDGNIDSEIDENAPHMENELAQFFQKIFVAGDVRVNENISLTTMHLIFMREHNRLADLYANENPTWTDEQIYQKARKLVGGKIQNILNNEWLPSLGVHLDPYQGYDESINPQLSNVFTAAAFRIGHTLLNSTILQIDETGEHIAGDTLELRDAFFNPVAVANSIPEDIIRGMGVQIQQKFDIRVIDDVRNLLFGAPGSGAGGSDLMAINIQRGRERGLGDYNSIREAYGLEKLTEFEQITSNAELVAVLKTAYSNDINNIDAFVGMVAEEAQDKGIFGPTVHTILKYHFSNLRDGDRFYFLNDEGITTEEKEEISSTRLLDIIVNNTDIELMQGNVFKMMTMKALEECEMTSPLVDINGNVKSLNGNNLESVSINFEANINTGQDQTDGEGNFSINRVPACYSYSLIGDRNTNPTEGVTTSDIIGIIDHILLKSPFTTPYQSIAADVTNDDRITVSDIQEIRSLILGNQDEFFNVDSWKFIDKDFDFGINDLLKNLPDSIFLPSLVDNMNIDVIGIKMGDINSNANRIDVAQPRTSKVHNIAVHKNNENGSLVSIDINIEKINEVSGFQFSLSTIGNAEIVDVSSVAIENENFAWHSDINTITSSWNGNLTDGNILNIVIDNPDGADLSDILILHDRITKSESYDNNIEVHDLNLTFAPEEGNATAQNMVFEFAGNNPFSESTTLAIQTLENATLEIYNIDGKLIEQQFINGEQFVQLIDITEQSTPKAGTYIAKLTTPNSAQVLKLVKI